MEAHLPMVDQQSTSGMPRPLWRIVLVCSLALNLAIAGVIGGSLISGRFGDGPPRSFDLGLGPVSRALTQDERRDIGRIMRRDRSLRDIDLRGRASDMVQALKAEPFDADVLRSLMAEQSARVADMQSRAQDAFIAAIADMSTERRTEFADQLARELSKVRPPRARPSGG